MGSGKNPGVVCGGSQPIDVDDGTLCRAASPQAGPTGLGLYSMSGGGAGYDGLSYEIGACFNLSEFDNTSRYPFEEMQVLAFLRKFKPHIVDAEQRYGTDRRAVAGAIAWEMLHPPRGGEQKNFVGSVGKFHLLAGSGKQLRYTLGHAALGSLLGDPGLGSLAYEVEALGYRPSKGYSDRSIALNTPEGAIPYIAAAMKIFSDVAKYFGFGSLLRNPEILTNLYQSKNVSDAIEHFKKKSPKEKLQGGNEMDKWVVSNIAFLQDAVGSPGSEASAPDMTDELKRNLELSGPAAEDKPPRGNRG